MHCPPDLMHDELEGNVPLHVSLVLYALNAAGLLDKEDINQRIRAVRENKVVTRNVDLGEISETDWRRIAKGKHIRFTGMN